MGFKNIFGHGVFFDSFARTANDVFVFERKLTTESLAGYRQLYSLVTQGAES